MAGAKLLDQYCLDHSVKVAVTIGHRLVEPSRETVGYLPEGDPLPLPRGASGSGASGSGASGSDRFRIFC